MIAHTVGEDVVGRAAVAVFLEVVKRLRRGAGAEQQQNTRSRCEHLHERRSLISRSWRRYWRPVEPTLFQARIVHPRRPSRASTMTTGAWLARYHIFGWAESPEGGQDNRRFASEKCLIEPPRDLRAQVRELGRRMRRARARDRNVGEDPRRTDREQQQTVGEPDGLFDVVGHQ